MEYTRANRSKCREIGSATLLFSDFPIARRDCLESPTHRRRFTNGIPRRRIQPNPRAIAPKIAAPYPTKTSSVQTFAGAIEVSRLANLRGNRAFEARRLPGNRGFEIRCLLGNRNFEAHRLSGVGSPRRSADSAYEEGICPLILDSTNHRDNRCGLLYRFLLSALAHSRTPKAGSLALRARRPGRSPRALHPRVA